MRPVTEAHRERAKKKRQSERRRKQIAKRLRKPWLIFRHRMRRSMLEDAARAATGLDDFGDRYYASGLERLLDSLRESELTFLGRIMTQRSVLLALKQRLLITDLRRRDRRFFDRALPPPIIVTGLPRTGTTLLHRLLADDPALRAPILSELIAPIGTPSRLTVRFNRLRLAAELFTLRRYTANLDAMHVSRPDMPEECMFAMSMSFRSMLFWTLSPCHAYMEWYAQASRAEKYADYRDILLLLQSHAPERRLVLKAPDHLGSVAELLEAVPEALVVVCHRRVPEALTSFNSLIYALHQSVSSAADPLRVARTNLLYFDAETRRYIEARRSRAQRILEIDYEELIADPLAVIGRIYDRAGLAVTSDVERRFRAFIAANPKDRLGSHRYRASDFGQDDAMIAERLAHYAPA
jgi:hypothetical protein